MLNDAELGVTQKTDQNRMGEALGDLSNTQTPNGTLLHPLELDFDRGSRKLDIINPFALLYHLTSICAPFADMMSAAVAKGRGALSLILYSDEVTPGNPMRSDKGRQTLNWHPSESNSKLHSNRHRL